MSKSGNLVKLLYVKKIYLRRSEASVIAPSFTPDYDANQVVIKPKFAQNHNRLPYTTMKLALLTYFAASLACTTAANADAMPELFGAEQLIDIEAHCEGCQPDYCYADKGEPADYKCYK